MPSWRLVRSADDSSGTVREANRRLFCLLVSYMPLANSTRLAVRELLRTRRNVKNPQRLWVKERYFWHLKRCRIEMAPRRAVALLLSTACASALVAPQPRLTRVAPLQSEPGPQPPAPEPEKPRPEPRPVIMPTVTGSNGEQIDVVSRLLKDRILLLGSEAVP